MTSGPARTLGKFRLVRELGRGRSGVVYEAEHTWTSRSVAVKVIAVAPHVEPEAVLTELRAAARLVHPNALSLIDAETMPTGELVVISELLRGESLRERLERQLLSLEESADVLLPIADALIAAHSADIIHRDVKPSNVFLAQGEAPTPKLLDFSIGNVFEATRLARSRAYLAPERWQSGDTSDPRADVWSLAVTWLESVTGMRPFETGAPGLAERGEQHLARFGPLGAMPDELRRVLARALEPDPRYRWPTMLEMRRAIAASLGRAADGVEMPAPISVELELPAEEEWPDDAAIDDDRPTERPEPRVDLPFASTPTPLGAVSALLAHGLTAIRFGVVPVAASFHDPAIGDTLARVLGAPVVVLRFGGYEELFAALKARRVELAWMAPAPFVRAAALGLVTGRFVSVRGGASSYVSVLLAHGARVHALEPRFLRKRRPAWVDPWSAAGYLMPRRVLRARGVDPDVDMGAPLMVGSYPAVVDSLRSGAADVGGVFGWRRDDGSMWHLGSDHDELVAMAVSEPIPSDVMALHALLPDEVSRAIARRLAAMDPRDITAQSLLAAVGAERLGRFEPSAYLSLAAATDEETRALNPRSP